MKRILITNPFGIGDVLFSTPLVKAIKKRFPDASITYICNRRAYGILKDNPRISKLYIFEKDEYRDLWKKSKIDCLKGLHAFFGKLRNERYEVLIDMSLNYLYSFLMMTFVRIPRRIGFNYRDRGGFLTDKLTIEGFNDHHVIEYYLQLLLCLGIETDDKDMELFVSEEDRAWADGYLAGEGVKAEDKICGIIPGCGASWGPNANYRRWSPWKFAQAANYATERYKFKTILFGEEKELSLCGEVASQMHTRPIQACGKTTLGQFAALLDRCDLIMTNDGGPLHMAVALNKNIVSIFGPVNEKNYGPYPAKPYFITVTSSESCRPCYRSFKHENCSKLTCLAKISPEMVIKCIDKLVSYVKDERHANISGDR